MEDELEGGEPKNVEDQKKGVDEDEVINFMYHFSFAYSLNPVVKLYFSLVKMYARENTMTDLLVFHIKTNKKTHRYKILGHRRNEAKIE